MNARSKGSDDGEIALLLATCIADMASANVAYPGLCMELNVESVARPPSREGLHCVREGQQSPYWNPVELSSRLAFHIGGFPVADHAAAWPWPATFGERIEGVHRCDSNGPVRDCEEHSAAPTLCALKGVGTDVAAVVLVAAGDNPARLRSEGEFANLCGVAPLPASSGKTSGRHRLNRGGDRHANCALWRVVIVRLATDAPTKHYMARRTQEGMPKPEIIRCLKRTSLAKSIASSCLGLHSLQRLDKQ
jgi:Transposase IS116/IS110/IS902 family